MQLKRTEIVLRPNSRRVVLRNIEPSDDQRKLKKIARLSTLSEAEVDQHLQEVLEEFHRRHQKPREFFLQRFDAVRGSVLTDASLTENRRLLIGAYFTQEYASVSCRSR